jgi:cytochrome c biogenesis protein CcmG/thiol:disulfide interchange protein DsbE
MRFIPLIFLVALIGFFAVWLQNPRDPSLVESVMIGKPAPIAEKGVVVNFFASWCATCSIENPTLLALKKSGVRVVGIDYKDKPEALKAWLKRFGNPYDKIIADPTGKIALDFGVYGVPETYWIDAKGIITRRHVGVLTLEDIK